MPDRISFRQGQIQVDWTARQLLVDGHGVHLGGRGFDVLAALVRHRDRVCSKAELLRAVWPGMVVEENNLHVQVKALRKLLGAEAIANVRGRGYAWTLEPDPPPARLLFGREELLERATGLLAARGTRVLTLHGPGGVGKTRVAMALLEHLPALRDGHCVVELEALHDDGLLPVTLARALGLTPSDAVPSTELLQAHLREREMLLVLDNAEHLPGVAVQLAPLLEAAPGLKVLATSRSMLKLAQEVLLEVPPLPVPEPGRGPDAARESPALRLFMQRAAEVGSPLREEPSDMGAAISICRRLDGLPLALELAAARLRVLSVSVLDEQLALSLRVAGAGRDAPPNRHRSLHDTLQWSAGLLSPGARRLLRLLGVFRGGFTLEAALAICGDDAAAPDRASLLDRLTDLLEFHLIQRHDGPGGGLRFTMLETIRQFAAESLRAGGEYDDVAARHASWFTQFAARQDRAVRGAARKAALQAMNSEHENLRAALAHLTRERCDGTAVLRLVACLSWWWYFAGLMTEGRRWQDEALTLPPPPRALAGNEYGLQRARVLSGACKLHFYLGDSERAMAVGREAVALARDAGDRETLAYALFHLAIPTRSRSSADCIALHDEARALFQRLSDAWGEALAVSYGGIPLAFDSSQQAAAQRRLGEGYRLFSALGDSWGCNVADQYLSVMALRRGDLAQARERAEATYRTSVELEDGFRTVSALHQLARVAIASGRYAEAEASLLRAVELNANQGRYGYASRLLQQCARLLARRGQRQLAVQIFGAASIDRGPMLTPVFLPEETAAAEAAREALREHFGDRAFDQCHAEGRRWSVARVIDELHRAVPDGRAGTQPPEFRMFQS